MKGLDDRGPWPSQKAYEHCQHELEDEVVMEERSGTHEAQPRSSRRCWSHFRSKAIKLAAENDVAVGVLRDGIHGSVESGKWQVLPSDRGPVACQTTRPREVPMVSM